MTQEPNDVDNKDKDSKQDEKVVREDGYSKLAEKVVEIGTLLHKFASFPSYCRRLLLKKYLDQQRSVLMFERPDFGKDNYAGLMAHLEGIKAHDGSAKYRVDLVSDEVEFKEKLQTKKFDLVTVDYFCEYLEPKLENKQKRECKVRELNEQLGELDKLIEGIRTNMAAVWCTDGHDLALEANEIIEAIPVNERPELAIHSRFGRKLVTTEDFNKLQNINISWLWKDKDLHEVNCDVLDSSRQREVKHLEALIRTSRLRRLDASIKKLSLIGLISGVVTIMLCILATENLESASPHILSILLGVFASLLVNAISFLISRGRRS
ncbi:hypothetical protein [Vibrio harveyi]|uniref:hypothetical protein n=1 Tax=Vibrio harveyi TaxID=669 RepID=UPI000841C978|nr:hypothetical protein [Vibrio harveyi]ODM56027.1 hypothetical protein BC455_22785 [Vibrio harveyi]